MNEQQIREIVRDELAKQSDTPEGMEWRQDGRELWVIGETLGQHLRAVAYKDGWWCAWGKAASVGDRGKKRGTAPTHAAARLAAANAVRELDAQSDQPAVENQPPECGIEGWKWVRFGENGWHLVPAEHADHSRQYRMAYCGQMGREYVWHTSDTPGAHDGPVGVSDTPEAARRACEREVQCRTGAGVQVASHTDGSIWATCDGKRCISTQARGWCETGYEWGKLWEDLYFEPDDLPGITLDRAAIAREWWRVYGDDNG